MSLSHSVTSKNHQVQVQPIFGGRRENGSVSLLVIILKVMVNIQKNELEKHNLIHWCTFRFFFALMYNYNKKEMCTFFWRHLFVKLSHYPLLLLPIVYCQHYLFPTLQLCKLLSSESIAILKLSYMDLYILLHHCLVFCTGFRLTGSKLTKLSQNRK